MIERQTMVVGNPLDGGATEVVVTYVVDFRTHGEPDVRIERVVDEEGHPLYSLAQRLVDELIEEAQEHYWSTHYTEPDPDVWWDSRFDRAEEG